MKKHLPTIFLILVFCIGLSLLLYPTISDYWNSLHQSRAIASYVDAVADINNNQYEDIWQAAKKYNSTLAESGNDWTLTEEELENYSQQLDVCGNGIMGYIEIPSIGCSLPIYHGIDEAVLQIAIGHIEGTSLPTGGSGTHTVLSGHRGLPSAKLFSDLDQLTEGDIFLLRILDETLTYEVDQILIVLPDEIDSIKVDKGKDLCTLVTCTPYGVNSHRLLVQGHRVDNKEYSQAVSVTADALQIEPILVATVVAIPMLLVLLLAPVKKKK